MSTRVLLLVFALAATACGDDDTNPVGPDATNRLGFFVTSMTSATGNFGGLRGADGLCLRLAAAVGAGGRTWHAYLSAERDPDSGNRPVDARSRIGNGPWVNANGVVVANSVADLHSRIGNVDVFVDENGRRINGQWPGSPGPTEHDILTGSTAQGTVASGLTCSSWTSQSPDQQAQVGHSDGLGAGGSTAGTAVSWNAAHVNGSCANTAPRGGAGRVYCFALQ
jgi:hypothetical protein